MFNKIMLYGFVLLGFIVIYADILLSGNILTTESALYLYTDVGCILALIGMNKLINNE